MERKSPRLPRKHLGVIKKEKSKTQVISFQGENITITKGKDGLWRDSTGCVYALVDDAASTDSKVRAGVGIFSMPEGSPINSDPAVAVHDYKYSSPAYQTFNTRKEADDALYEGIKKMKTWHRHLALPFWALSRIFGGLFWENDETR